MWFAQSPFDRRVKLSWTRESRTVQETSEAPKDIRSSDVAKSATSSDASSLVEDSIALDDALWRQRGNAHYLSYEEDTKTRVTLKLQDKQVTMIRHGNVEWNARFEAGTKTSSILYIGGQGMPIEIDTKSLGLTVTDAGGSVDMFYGADISGHVERVHLQITFEVLE